MYHHDSVTVDNTLWTSLRLPPSNCNSNFIQLNENEFIVASKTTTTKLKCGIYKYNTITDNWNLLFKYPTNFGSFTSHICMDNLKLKLYIINRNDYNKVIIIENITYKYKIIQSTASTLCASGIVINNELHVIIVDDSECGHMILNESEHKLICMTRMRQWRKKLYQHGLVYVQKRNIILLFGGVYNGEPNDEIWMYSLTYNDPKWELLTLKLPERMYGFGYALSSNEDYIFILGGSTLYGSSKIIYVWNLEQMTFRLGHVACPSSGWFFALSMCHKYTVELVVNGYIRKRCFVFIPQDILQLIKLLHGCEYIHLFLHDKRNLKYLEHWKTELNML
eukprot:344952_1